MKKNILTIVIMAASIINLVLTAVLIFSVMPAMNKTSNLIDKVASVIDLEIESKNEEDVLTPIENMETVTIPYEANVNINLQKSDDTNHYAVISGIVVSLNKEEDDCADIKTLMETNTVYVEDIVKETISSFTADTISQTAVKEEAVKKLRERYNTKCIVDLSLPGYLIS